MDALKDRHEELKNELNSIFATVTDIANKISSGKKQYDPYLNQYLNSLEFLKNKSELKGKIEEISDKLERLKAEHKDTIENISKLSESYTGVINTFDKLLIFGSKFR